MGFSNSVVGGITLVRPAIQSPNFVTGTSGWSINRDGSAEFLNLLVRGIFEAGGTGSSPHITFLAAPNLPAPIATYQYLGSLTIKSAIIFYATNGSPSDYFFIGFVDNIGAEIVVMGYVRAGVVQELTTGDPLGLQIIAASQFPLPPGSLALTQAVRAVGNFSTTSSYLYVDTQEYSTGTSTITLASLAPYRGLIFKYQAPGAGGGGCAASGGGANVSVAGGGGGGGFIQFFIHTADLGGNITITLPAGGAGGTAGNNNGVAPAASSISDGASLSYTATAPSPGGGGAASGAAGFGGGGGNGGSIANTGSIGSTLLRANGGDVMTSIRQAGFFAQLGYGGSSFLAGQRRLAASTVGAAGQAGNPYGGGGSGAYDGPGNAARAGGAGADGRVFVDLLR